MIVAGEGPRVDLRAVFDILGNADSLRSRGGGSELPLFSRQMGAKAVAFIAPKWVGGRDAPSAVGGVGAEDG